MLIIVLQELCVYHLLDMCLFNFMEYIRKIKMIDNFYYKYIYNIYIL